MTNDPLSFIDAPATPDAPKTPEPAPSDAPPATDGQSRDAQGRFTAVAPKEPVAPAPKAPDPAPQAVAPAPAAPAPVTPQEHSVPLAKYLDRDSEARELRRENQRLQQQLQAKNAPPRQMPDPIQDPDGYRQAIMDEVRQDYGKEVDAVRNNMSEQMARQVHGNDKVDTAFKAFEEAIAGGDVLSYQRVARSPHPADEIVKWHQERQLLAEIGTDPKAYRDRIIAEHMATLQQSPAGGPAAAPPPSATPVVPPPSLSRAPAGAKAADVPVGPGQAFDGLFAR